MTTTIHINQEVFAKALPLADELNAFSLSRGHDARDEYLACLLCAIGIARVNARALALIVRDLGCLHAEVLRAEAESQVFGEVDKSELN